MVNNTTINTTKQSMGKQTFEERVVAALEKISKALSDFERKEAIIQADVHDIRKSTTMQTLDLSMLKSDQRELLGRIRTLEDGQIKIEQTTQDLQGDMRSLGVLQEQIDEKIDQVIEAVMPQMHTTTEHSLRLEEHKTQLKNHDFRLASLEKAA